MRFTIRNLNAKYSADVTYAEAKMEGEIRRKRRAIL